MNPPQKKTAQRRGLEQRQIARCEKPFHPLGGRFFDQNLGLRRELARFGIVYGGLGQRVAGQRSFAIEGLRRLLFGWPRSTETRPSAAENGQGRGTRSNSVSTARFGAMDICFGKVSRCLPVHSIQNCAECQTDHPRSSQPLGQGLGALAWSSTRRLCLPFLATYQGRYDVRSRGARRRYLKNVWTRVRGIHPALSGHHAEPGYRDVLALRFGCGARQSRAAQSAFINDAIQSTASLRDGNWLMITAICITSLWGFGVLAQTALPSDLQAIVDRYETCLDAAQTRTREVGNAALRPKFFDALSKQCDRQRDAELSIAQSEAGIARTEAEQDALRAEIAAMTDGLIMGTRAELGLALTE